MKKKINFSVSEFGAVLLVLAFFGGYISNIVKLIGDDYAYMTGLLVGRIIGVFVAPLGAVLGFL